MDIKKVQTVNKEVTTHTFYCDDCNEYIGKSEEYPDGYYETLGRFKLEFDFPGPGGYKYTIRKCFCKKCKNEFLSELKNTLKNFGFKKE